MKLFNILKKDFKILLRSKASGFLVLFGPLIILLLISIFFTGKSSYDFSVGFYDPGKTELSSSFVSALKNTSYSLREFSDEASCVAKVKQGVIHTCIVFPKDFRLSNDNSNELRFLVDYSKINLVYKVVDSVSGILDLESKELSYSLTNLLLIRINSTLKDIDRELEIEKNILSSLDSSSLDLSKAGFSLGSVKFDFSVPNTSLMNSKINKTNASLQIVYNNTLALVEESRYFIRMLDDYLNSSEIEGLNAELDEIANEVFDSENNSIDNLHEFSEVILKLESEISRMQSDISSSKQLNEDAKQKIVSAKKFIDSAKSSLLTMESVLLSSRDSLRSISVNRAEAIVSPVNTRIEPVVLESSNMVFTFPFLVILMIMFISLFLSSTLVVFEKNSKAVFRNYVTPTRPRLFAFGSFLTCFIIIFCQSLIIFILANYFLEVSVIPNIVSIFAIVFSSIIFFISLGMLSGKLFSSNEGAVMSSIILGCVFLFASNLVLPLESLAPFFSGIIKYNPFIIFSELLRKVILFNTPVSDLFPLLPILLGIAIIILVFIIYSRRWITKKSSEPKKKIVAEDLLSEIRLSESRVFVCGNKKASNKKELFNLVSEMTRAEFEDNVNLHSNKIADWLEFSHVGESKLSSKIRKTISKKEILELLAESIRKDSQSSDDSSKKESD